MGIQDHRRQRYFPQFREQRHSIWRMFAAVVFVLCLTPLTVLGQSEGDEPSKGVFAGDHVGCRTKPDLLAYYKADKDEDRTVTDALIIQNKCLAVKGLAYVPLRVGFVTAHVRVTYREEDMQLWVRTAAVVESPPPQRQTHFNF